MPSQSQGQNETNNGSKRYQGDRAETGSTSRDRNDENLWSSSADLNSAKDRLLEQVGDWAEKVKVWIPKGGSIESVTKPIFAKVNSVNSYLTDRSAGDITSDFYGVVTRNPAKIAFTLLGGALGYALASRILDNSNATRSVSSGAKDKKQAKTNLAAH